MRISITHFTGIFKNTQLQTIFIQFVIGGIQFPGLYQVVREMVFHIIQTTITSENSNPYPSQFMVIVFFGKQCYLLQNIRGRKINRLLKLQ